MPIFDFLCKDCGNRFDLMISNARKEDARCPECGSANIEQLLSLFNTGGSAKTSDNCAGCSNVG